MSSVKWDLYRRGNKVREHFYDIGEIPRIPRDIVRNCISDNLRKLIIAKIYENVMDLKIDLRSAISATVRLHIKEVAENE